MSGSFPLELDRATLAAICARYGVARLLVFGSAIRDDFGPHSDVDILVEFAAATRIGLLELARLQIELSELLDREVHLTTPRSLSRYFREDVLAHAVPVYVAA